MTKASYYVSFGLKRNKSIYSTLFLSIACLDDTERFQSSEVNIDSKISSIVFV